MNTKLINKVARQAMEPLAQALNQEPSEDRIVFIGETLTRMVTQAAHAMSTDPISFASAILSRVAEIEGGNVIITDIDPDTGEAIPTENIH